MNNTLIAALYKIAEDAGEEENPLVSLTQSLRRITAEETSVCTTHRV